MRKILFQLFLAGIITMQASIAQTPAAVIPDFTFYKFNQAAFTKHDLPIGKPSFFIFFDTECDHCQHAIVYLNQHCNELSKAAVYLVSLDSREKMSAFLNKFAGRLLLQKNVLLLQDKKNEFIGKFTPRKYPSLFLYSAKGRLLLYGDEEKGLPVFLQKIKA